jgi:hypothetical protein
MRSWQSGPSGKSTCLASMRPSVQTPKKEKKPKDEMMFKPN